MDYFERVGRSVDYIETNLKRDINLTYVADQAYCSLFYFHRLFLGMLGDTVMEYIRKRRLTEAARLLTESDVRILDIAIDLGYGSQESFTRAFKSGYGMNPGRFRTLGLFYPLRERKTVDQLRFDHTIRSGSMEFTIVKKPAFTVIGKQIVTKSDGSNFKEIPLFWGRYLEEKVMEKVPNRKEPWTQYGLCSEGDSSTGSFVYMIGEEVTSTAEIPPGLLARTVPEATYAVFTAKGPTPETIQKVASYIFGTWLPGSTEWEHAGTEDFELYDERCTKETPEVDIYVPVKKK